MVHCVPSALDVADSAICIVGSPVPGSMKTSVSKMAWKARPLVAVPVKPRFGSIWGARS
jgi:hypothetical protein